MKKIYDRKVYAAKLEIGDRVLVRSVGLKGTHKLADKWEHSPYCILSIPQQDIPVYRVQKEDGHGPIRTLHRNMLLQFNCLPLSKEVQIGQKPRSKPKVGKSIPESSSSSPSSSDESDSYERYIIP